MRRPATVIIGLAGQVVDRIEQRAEIINDENRKKARLLEILGSGEFTSPIIIFVNQKTSCDVLAKSLDKSGVCRLLCFMQVNL